MAQRLIYVSTACLPGIQDVNSRVLTYLDHGFHHIELGAGVSVKDDLSCLAHRDCDYTIHNFFPPADKSFVLNLASSNEEIRKRSIEFVLASMDLCARLRAPFYSVHAGFITDPIGFGSKSFILPMPDSSYEEKRAMDRFISSVDLCVAYATKMGLQILIENNVCPPELRGRLLLQTAEEFLTLFNALSSPNLGILLDTGHLNVTAHTYGFNRVDFFEDTTKFIRAFHIHDNCGDEDTHLPIDAGSWVVDVLHQPEFAKHPIIIEAKFNSIDDLMDHFYWLKGELF